MICWMDSLLALILLVTIMVAVSQSIKATPPTPPVHRLVGTPEDQGTARCTFADEVIKKDDVEKLIGKLLLAEIKGEPQLGPYNLFPGEEKRLHVHGDIIVQLSSWRSF
ncbi:unnamed protein product [Calypogeia fissa]